MKIWHINNIASTGSTFVTALNKIGISAEFHDAPKPFAKSIGVLKIFGLPTRLRHARRLLKQARREKVDILHIHYSSAASWFLYGGIPTIVHAHGSDVRIFWWNGLRHFLNFLVIRASAAAYYSTPDMAPLLARYTDRAKFAPNPVDVDLFRAPSVPRDPNLIFLYAPLDHIKGADTAIAAIKILKGRYPQLRFQTIGQGIYVDDARSAGIEVLPRTERKNLPAILGKAGLILGQFRVGAIGLSELEVLSMERTIACYFIYDHLYAEPPPFIPANTVQDIVNLVEAYIKNPTVYSPLDSKAREWVCKFHGPDKVARDFVADYQAILASALPQQDRHNKPVIPERS